jgi:hypothetical protein
VEPTAVLAGVTDDEEPEEPPTTDPALEQRVTKLEQEVKNLNENILARLKWLETGQTGPDYKGTGTGKVTVNIPFFGSRSVPVSIEVLSKPVIKEE